MNELQKDVNDKNGKFYVVGIGPGDLELISMKAYRIIQNADTVVGYKRYIELISEIISSTQEIYSSGMRGEIERAKMAIIHTLQGKAVVLISSGDPGVYGMAGLIFELISKEGLNLAVEIIPGITAANAAASSLGAPLMHDYAVISLSDLLTPWSVIMERIELAARADFVIILYNPRSNQRKKQLEIAINILLKHKKSDTPVGIVRNAKRRGEKIIITTLSDVLNYEVDMLTTVIIGNKDSFAEKNIIITPRGYQI